MGRVSSVNVHWPRLSHLTLSEDTLPQSKRRENSEKIPQTRNRRNLNISLEPIGSHHHKVTRIPPWENPMGRSGRQYKCGRKASSSFGSADRHTRNKVFRQISHEKYRLGEPLYLTFSEIAGWRSNPKHGGLPRTDERQRGERWPSNRKLNGGW